MNTTHTSEPAAAAATSAHHPIVATRRLLPLDADGGMLAHALVYLATQPLPVAGDRPARTQWLAGLYRVMASAAPEINVTSEDVRHALAFHIGVPLEIIDHQRHIETLRDAARSAVQGMRLVARD
jgi:hypothetical protein